MKDDFFVENIKLQRNYLAGFSQRVHIYCGRQFASIDVTLDHKTSYKGLFLLLRCIHHLSAE